MTHTLSARTLHRIHVMPTPPLRPAVLARGTLALLILIGAFVVLPGHALPAKADVYPLVFPVAGGASWVDTFGAPRSGGRTHQGQDLFAPKMRPLVASADGVVVRMGRKATLSGNYVVIKDAEGWEYVYVHLNNDHPGTDDGADIDLDAFAPGIYVGAKVFSGQTLGYLGDSGNAETTPPHLHYEIRTPDGVSINPADRLRSAVGYTLDPRLVEAHSPFGGWDSTILAPGGFEVGGWGIDPDSTKSLTIEAYVDRNLARTLPANRPRPDIAAAYPGKGELHGFADVVPVPNGVHEICLAVRNDDRGPASVYGCRVVGRSTTPFGSLDNVVRVPGALYLNGWTLDSDTADPTDVHGYVDQTGVATVASLTRGDVGAVYPKFGSARGFALAVPVGPGRHEVCAYGINAAGTGGVSVLACRTVDVHSDPIGRVDGVQGGPGQVAVSGWALDPDTTAANDIHVYVDGRGVNLGPANASRPDVASIFPSWGAAHGFAATLPLDRGGDHQICAYAINLGYGGNVSLGCTAVRTPTGSPVGVTEVIQRTAGGVRVSGWALDPDTTAPVDIHVYVGGQGTNLGAASLARPDLAPHYPAYGTGHGFDATIAAPAAPTQACVYAIDRAGGQPPRLLACGTV